MPFVTVENKEDSQEKLLYAAGKPTPLFLFAGEVNEIVDKINLLRHMIVIQAETIPQIIASGVEVALGEIDTDPMSFIDNGETSYGLGTEGATFVTYTLEGVYYVIAFVGTPGLYGGDSTRTLEESDFLPLYDSSQAASQVFASGIYMAKITAGGSSVERQSIPAAVTYSTPGTGIFQYDCEHFEPGKTFVTAVLISNVDIGADYKVVPMIANGYIRLYHMLNGVLTAVQASPEVYIALKIETYP